MFTLVTEACPLLEELIIDSRTGLVPNCRTHQPDPQSPLRYCISRPFVDAFHSSRIRGGDRKPRIVLVGQRLVNPRETEEVFSFFYTINCVEDITTVYPVATFYCHRGLGDAGDLQWETDSQPLKGNQVEEGMWMRYSIPSSGQEVDLLDASPLWDLPESQLGSLLEGPSWVQLGHGARLPYAHRRGHEYGWPYTTPLEALMDNAVKAREQHPPGSRLWYWEDRVGRNLLHVQTYKGHDLPECPKRERPLEELDMDPCWIPMLQLEGLPSSF